MRGLVLVLVVLLSGCSGTFGSGGKSRTLQHVNNAGLALSVGALACDGGQTLNAAIDRQSKGWGVEQGFPTQMLIGNKPDPGSVAIYFVAASAVLLGAAQYVPERLRPLVYAAVIAGESYTVYDNVVRGKVSVCGI